MNLPDLGGPTESWAFASLALRVIETQATAPCQGIVNRSSKSAFVNPTLLVARFYLNLNFNLTGMKNTFPQE